MSNSDPDLVEHLKSLEGNNYISETALFDILNEIGVVLPKGYRSGSRNKELARKEVNRYIEYKSLHEIDPNYKKKRAVTITKVRDLPIPKEDGRGSSGRYADYLRPLIVKTAIDYPFRGTKTELFDSWGVYNNYREEQIRNGLFNPNIGRSFNPWSIKKDMQPGETKYCQIISFKERNSLETALDSLSKEGVIEWSKYTRYAPIIKTTEFIDSVERLKTWQEYQADCDRRMNMIIQLSEEKNCVLSPKLFQAGLIVSQSTYDTWSQLYYGSNGEQLPDEQATAEQEVMYENYQAFIRQLTVRECSNSKVFCLPDSIPNKFDIFTDWTYRRKYNDLDKSWKGQLLGWEQVRQELYIKIVDEGRAIKYLEQYSPELAFELGCEYILYMEEHMDKEKLYYPQGYTEDHMGIFNTNETSRTFLLKSSKTAVQLHENLKRLFYIAF